MEPGHWDKALNPEEEKEDVLENKMKVYKQKTVKDEDFDFDLKKPVKMICREIMAEEKVGETEWEDIINSINKEY